MLIFPQGWYAGGILDRFACKLILRVDVQSVHHVFGNDVAAFVPGVDRGCGLDVSVAGNKFFTHDVPCAVPSVLSHFYQHFVGVFVLSAVTYRQRDVAENASGGDACVADFAKIFLGQSDTVFTFDGFLIAACLQQSYGNRFADVCVVFQRSRNRSRRVETNVAYKSDDVPLAFFYDFDEVAACGKHQFRTAGCPCGKVSLVGVGISFGCLLQACLVQRQINADKPLDYKFLCAEHGAVRLVGKLDNYRCVLQWRRNKRQHLCARTVRQVVAVCKEGLAAVRGIGYHVVAVFRRYCKFQRFTDVHHVAAFGRNADCAVRCGNKVQRNFGVQFFVADCVNDYRHVRRFVNVADNGNCHSVDFKQVGILCVYFKRAIAAVRCKGDKTYFVAQFVGTFGDTDLDFAGVLLACDKRNADKHHHCQHQQQGDTRFAV